MPQLCVKLFCNSQTVPEEGHEYVLFKQWVIFRGLWFAVDNRSFNSYPAGFVIYSNNCYFYFPYMSSLSHFMHNCEDNFSSKWSYSKTDKNITGIPVLLSFSFQCWKKSPSGVRCGLLLWICPWRGERLYVLQCLRELCQTFRWCHFAVYYCVASHLITVRARGGRVVDSQSFNSFSSMKKLEFKFLRQF